LGKFGRIYELLDDDVIAVFRNDGLDFTVLVAWFGDEAFVGVVKALIVRVAQEDALLAVFPGAFAEEIQFELIVVFGHVDADTVLELLVRLALHNFVFY
jgi:hypothetical protein